MDEPDITVLARCRATVAALWRRRTTLRVRFALWVAGLLLLALIAFGAFVYVRLARSLAEAIDESLQLSATQAIAAVHVADGRLSSAGGMPEPRELSRSDHMIRLLNRDGQVLQTVGPYGSLPVDPTSRAAALDGQPAFATMRDPVSGDPVRVRTAPIFDDDRVIGAVQVAQSLEDLQDTLQRLLAALLLSVPLLVALAALGGYMLAARALAPIDAITRTARQISAADLHARLNLPATDDEVGRLAATFDAMLARLDDSFQRERRFTADASHELRTPLAAMQTILGVMRAQRRTPEDYERALDDLASEAERLRRLVDDLLRLARGDARPIAAQTSVDLSTLVDDVVETIGPLAEDKGLTLDRAIAPGLLVPGDRDELIRLFLNLLDNAAKYTERGGITIAVGQEQDTIVVRVSDTGSGIDPAHLPHVFERFYRVDSARGGDGSGLGLAIAHEIVQDHGGTIALHSTPGGGTTCIVRLPRA